MDQRRRAEGFCDPAFAGVRELFDAILAHDDDDGELGGAVAAQVAGRTVVDLWGGVADGRSGRAWQRDTACVAFSATKAVTAAAALLLAERGAVSLANAVATWWPEFAAAGKDGVTGVHLLTHQAGLPFFERPIDAAQAADFDALAAELARQAPQWPPGSAHGYHATTFGWLVGELIRRASGVSVREFVHAELGADLHIGVAADALDGSDGPARIAAGRPSVVDELPAPKADAGRLVAATRDPSSPFSRSTGNPAASFNSPALLTAQWPAANLVVTARALADFYARLTAGRILAPATIRDAVRERVRGPDRTLVLESAFGLGFMLPSASLFLPSLARPTAFGHPGASGALGLGDLERQVAFGYLPNVARPALGDRRAHRLVRALYESL
ncbi:serine hydrolase domain-containing protein [uncultured Jatrophihabitans sp.]|uniref:serine hydrolase domain-containing protein n=1 Tax=uncultured Jatrophihabitans sp. TaxID=1610747 RepID=UPI0035CB0655